MFPLTGPCPLIGLWNTYVRTRCYKYKYAYIYICMTCPWTYPLIRIIICGYVPMSMDICTDRSMDISANIFVHLHHSIIVTVCFSANEPSNKNWLGARQHRRHRTL